MKIAPALLLLALGAAPALPAADEEIPVAGTPDVPVPKRIKSVVPEYPPEAQAQGLRGIVILEVTVDPTGRVSATRVIRSVPPFDGAALAAVRQWVYEPPRVKGQPGSVRFTVPITFALKLPDLEREPGVPELRQGAAPGVPAGAPAQAVAVRTRVLVDPQGNLLEASVLEGDSPWAEAVIAALRTWRFTPAADGASLTFEVRTEFKPQAAGPATVTLSAGDVRRVEGSDALPGPIGSPAPPAVASASPAPAPSAAPAAPAAAEPAAQPSPAPPATTPRAPSAEPATAPPRPAAPPVEVISAPRSAPPVAAAPPRPAPGPGVSAVADVHLGEGVPDLGRGRRPVVPPFARIQHVSGTVEVHFSVDSSGATQIQEAIGPDSLKEAARAAVQSWDFRRTTPERLYLVARFTYDGDRAVAAVRRAE